MIKSTSGVLLRPEVVCVLGNMVWVSGWVEKLSGCMDGNLIPNRKIIRMSEFISLITERSLLEAREIFRSLYMLKIKAT